MSKVYKGLLSQSRKFKGEYLVGALESGKRRCVQQLATGQCKKVPRKFWRSLQWSEKLCFDRPDKYDPDFFVYRPQDFWPVLASQAAEESEPERKRAKGGGAKSVYTHGQKEFGKAIYREILRDDPGWRMAGQEAVAEYVREKAGKAGRKLVGHWKTIYRNIVAPVNAETE
jgi:hypothetical protein